MYLSKFPFEHYVKVPVGVISENRKFSCSVAEFEGSTPTGAQSMLTIQ